MSKQKNNQAAHKARGGRGRGRPRSFDVDAAVDTATALFHRHGYDGVRVAELGEQLGIKPPSLYAAFGSKAELFERCVQAYEARSQFIGAPLADPELDTVEALALALRGAARAYAADPERPGCMVIDGKRNASDTEVCARIGARIDGLQVTLEQRVARTHPKQARLAADFMVTTLRGLSAAARDGVEAARLLDVAETAAAALGALLRS